MKTRRPGRTALPCKAFLLILVSMLTACSEPTSELRREIENAIIEGQIVPGGHPLKKSVVKIVDLTLTGEQRICSGTLVSRNVVLTAAHCLFKNKISDGVEFDEIKPLNGFAVALYSGGIESLIAVKNARTFGLPTKEPGASDLALLQLESSLSSAEPVEFLNDLSRLDKGAEVLIAGYGRSSIDQPESTSPLRIGRMIIREFQQNLSEVTLQKRDGSNEITCSGDSGGPVFIQIDGQYRFWGVLRRGDFLCSYASVYTKAYLFNSWIQSVVEKWK